MSYNPWEEVIQQYYDLAIIVGILWVFRARRWPEYFTVGLFDGEAVDHNQTNEQLIEQYRVVPVFSTQIDEKILHSSQGFDKTDNISEYGLNQSFDSDAQVIFINPCDVDGYNMSTDSPDHALANESAASSK